MTSPTKGKFNTKLIAAIIIIVIVVSLAAVTAQYMLSQPQQQSSELSEMTLTLIGSAGQQRNLTKQDILALEPYSA
jgi:flagellar basal body-associated protein FliL